MNRDKIAKLVVLREHRAPFVSQGRTRFALQSNIPLLIYDEHDDTQASTFYRLFQ